MAEVKPSEAAGVAGGRRGLNPPSRWCLGERNRIPIGSGLAVLKLTPDLSPGRQTKTNDMNFSQDIK